MGISAVIGPFVRLSVCPIPELQTVLFIETTVIRELNKVSPRVRRDDMPPAADGSSTVPYHFAANQAISTYMYVRIAADLRPSADGSAVRTPLVAAHLWCL